MICSICNISNTDGARFCTSCGAGLNVEKLTPQTSFGVSGDLIGSTISGKYRLDAKLGAGGMGIVYRATRLLIGDEVAVKILRSTEAS